MSIHDFIYEHDIPRKWSHLHADDQVDLIAKASGLEHHFFAGPLQAYVGNYERKCFENPSDEAYTNLCNSSCTSYGSLRTIPKCLYKFVKIIQTCMRYADLYEAWQIAYFTVYVYVCIQIFVYA